MSAQVDFATLAADLEVLGTTALRLATILRSGLADLGDPSGHRDVPPGGTRNGSECLSAVQVAEMLGVGPRTLRRWRHEGRAPRPLRGSGLPRWRRTDVLRFLEQRSAEDLAENHQ